MKLFKNKNDPSLERLNEMLKVIRKYELDYIAVKTQLKIN